MDFYNKTIDETFRELGTSDFGLTKEEVEKRHLKGLNVLPKKNKDTLFKVFIRQFVNPIIYILAFAVLFSFIIGEYLDGIFIIAVVLLDVFLGTYQEWQAKKTAESLKDSIKNVVSVLRNGEKALIESQYIVVGDIVYLASGDKVPADLRIINSYNLTVDESFLTGESINSNKNNEIIKDNVHLSDQTNICFGGSKIMSGRCTGAVIKTGSNTEIGKIATEVLQKEEKPPLVIRIEKFSKQISKMAIILAILLTLMLYFKGYVLEDIFFLVVALLISAIPEGLPVILTITLSIATKRMLKQNVIVKKLNAVEGLGSATVIASDKTGTLTVNEQTLKAVFLKSGSVFDVTGIGYNGVGEIIPVNETSKNHIEELKEFAKLVEINNEAELKLVSDKWESRGDAIDIAFLAFSKKVGIIEEVEALSFIPYESEKRYSGVFYKEIKDSYITVKGSPEKILDFCKEDKSTYIRQANKLAKEGYRVIAVAKGKVKKFVGKNKYDDRDIPKLDFLGFACFIDPIREEAPSAIEKCLNAGIKVVMITGDHKLTAFKIAKDLNLVNDIQEVCEGLEIESIANEKQLDKFIKNKKVFSRVNPSQKLQIINSYKRQGEFIAVTGDGVNDAPALNGANIGVAMGNGTDVAKETGSIIIADSNFSSIVKGVEEGRIAYENIRKVVYLLMSCAIAEVMFIVLAIVFNMPIPFLAVQLLWLNLITEGIQDTALAFEKGDGNAMNQKPRSPKENLFDKLLIKEVLLAGITMLAIMFGLWVYLINIIKIDVTLARSLEILLVVFLQNFQAINCRSEYKSIFKIPLKNNKYIVWAVIVTFAIQLLASETTIFDFILKTTHINLIDVLYLFLISLPLIIVMEIFKRRNHEKRIYTN